MAGDAGAAAFDAAAYDQKIAELVRKRRRNSTSSERRPPPFFFLVVISSRPCVHVSDDSFDLSPRRTRRFRHDLAFDPGGGSIEALDVPARALAAGRARRHFFFVFLIRRRRQRVAHAIEKSFNQMKFTPPSTERRGRRRVLLRVGRDRRVVRPDGTAREPPPRHLRGMFSSRVDDASDVEETSFRRRKK